MPSEQRFDFGTMAYCWPLFLAETQLELDWSGLSDLEARKTN